MVVDRKTDLLATLFFQCLKACGRSGKHANLSISTTPTTEVSTRCRGSGFINIKTVQCFAVTVHTKGNVHVYEDRPLSASLSSTLRSRSSYLPQFVHYSLDLPAIIPELGEDAAVPKFCLHQIMVHAYTSCPVVFPVDATRFPGQGRA